MEGSTARGDGEAYEGTVVNDEVEPPIVVDFTNNVSAQIQT